MSDLKFNQKEIAAAKGPAGFDSIHRPDLVTVVTDFIRQRVLDGRYAAGYILPAEAELAKAFAVSRNVMREALRNLRMLGLVEVSQGRPPRIRGVSTEASVNALGTLLKRCEGNLEQMMETRMPLEIQVAGLLARAAQAPDLAQPARFNREMNEGGDYRMRSNADQAFHCSLARATGNQILATVLETVIGLTFELRDNALSLAGFPDWPSMEEYRARNMTEHKGILEAIAARDEEAACKATRQHMEGVVDTFRMLERACRGGTRPDDTAAREPIG